MVVAANADGEHNSSNDTQPRQQQHSLVDLAPTILRNACAGMCFWACQRGMRMCGEREAGSQSQAAAAAVGAYARLQEGEGQDSSCYVREYRGTARLLRDCAATAVLHSDMAQVLEGLDRQLAMFDAALQRV